MYSPIDAHLKYFLQGKHSLNCFIVFLQIHNYIENIEFTCKMRQMFWNIKIQEKHPKRNLPKVFVARVIRQAQMRFEKLFLCFFLFKSVIIAFL